VQIFALEKKTLGLLMGIKYVSSNYYGRPSKIKIKSHQ
jgi:hypothetical protein